MSNLLQQAVAQHQSGNLGEAERLYREILQTTPDQPDALALLGVVYGAKGDHDQAIALIEKAIAHDPQAALFKFYLGNALLAAGKNSRAADAFRHVALETKNVEAWFYLGLALNRLERHEEALKAYQTAHELAPNVPEIMDNIGLVLQTLNRPEQALAAFHELLQRTSQVIADDDMQAADDSAFSKWHYHLSLLELRMGDYRRGFARYRSRFNALSYRQRPSCGKLVWRGEDLKGKTILVYKEQGIGDTLMLCRYLPLLKRAGGRVIFLVQEVLAPLFEGWDGVDEVVTDQPTGGFDYCASVFDLPVAFSTELSTVPNHLPFLPVWGADAETRLEPSTKLKVGVVWAGATTSQADALRSVPLQVFAGIFDVPSVEFFSLNYDKRAGDAELLKSHPVTDLAPRLKDFVTTARFINQLDLIITCDTAMMHLAGGMGKPVWVLIPHPPDWTWLSAREDNVWYPTMRWFRQPQKDDWQGAVARVKIALHEAVKNYPKTKAVV